MALNTQIAIATVNAQADVINTLCSNGTITIYGGTQPANADTATTDTAGVVLTFGTTAFSVSGGVMTANAITSGVATATITPTWARIRTSGGATVMDVSAGVSGCNLTISAISEGVTVNCNSFVHTVKKSTTGF